MHKKQIVFSTHCQVAQKNTALGFHRVLQSKTKKHGEPRFFAKSGNRNISYFLFLFRRISRTGADRKHSATIHIHGISGLRVPVSVDVDGSDVTSGTVVFIDSPDVVSGTVITGSSPVAFRALSKPLTRSETDIGLIGSV